MFICKYDHKEEFKAKALELQAENQALIKDIQKVRDENKDIFGEVYSTHRSCFNPADFRKWQWCKNKRKLQDDIEDVSNGKPFFLKDKEEKLPKEFWESI